LRPNAACAQNAVRPRRRARAILARAGITLVSTAALALGFATAASAAPATSAARAAAPGRSAPAASPAVPDYRQACTTVTRPGVAHCLTLIRTTVRQRTQASLGPDAAPSGVGYGPSSLQGAYDLPSSTAGSGQTVAVVDAFDDPNAASDLATYRADWGLPACGTGCFEKVNQDGQASPLPAAAGSSGWDVEESLDLDMVSAICPNCHIILVETNSDDIADLGAGVNAAVSLGAKYVSNSYGGSESSTDLTYDSEFYNHPGVAVTASAGDSGYGVSYPAASQYVTAVGGTSLTQASNSRGWTETVWGSAAGGEGTGSGCSADDPKPSWQTDTGCARRTDNDVAAVADPNTGVATYDTYSQGGWLEVGGTSASSPIIASVFALAGPPAAGTYPSSYLYQHTPDLFDVTSGADGTCSPAYLCTAQAGYDGPTGWGTPDGTAAFTSATATGGGGGCTAAQLIGNPGFETGAITPWTSTPAVLASTAAGVPARSGSWLAWLDGYSAPHTDTLAQTVAIPAGCQNATFSFWLDIQTTDPASRASDALTVQVLGAGGTVLSTLATYSNLNASGGYRQHSFSLAPYIGQTVTLKFTGKETLSGSDTSFLDDDNALNVS
jgi:hypothetical protein